MSGRREKPHPKTCKRCPNRYNKQGCPFWLDDPVTEENIQNGEVRVVTGCMVPHIPRWIRAGIISGNRSAAAIESTRNAMDETLKAVRKEVARVDRVMVALQMQRDGNITSAVENLSSTSLAIEHQESEQDGDDDAGR